jgi:UDP-N-acetylglucosamine transferase subunit ALG13
MIFVTVGTDLPFDRMMRVVDSWARDHDRRDVFAQIGEGGWEPEYIEFTHFLQPPDFKRRFDEASLIISHAGMGTILTALLCGKPILVMPKRASFCEHRSEHQMATAKCMCELCLVQVAKDESQLMSMLNHLPEFIVPGRIVPGRIGPVASGSLIDSLHDFILRSPKMRSAETSVITKRS